MATGRARTRAPTGRRRSTTPTSRARSGTRAPTSTRRRSSTLAPLRACPGAVPRAWTLLLLRSCLAVGPLLFGPPGRARAAGALGRQHHDPARWRPSCVGFRCAGRVGVAAADQVTPGVGLLWFAFRREWRPLAAIAARRRRSWRRRPPSCPGLAGLDGRSVARAPARRPSRGRCPSRSSCGCRSRWPSSPGPPGRIASGCCRRASLLAMPVIWWGSFSMFAGCVALRRREIEAWLLGRSRDLRGRDCVWRRPNAEPDSVGAGLRADRLAGRIPDRSRAETPRHRTAPCRSAGASSGVAGHVNGVVPVNGTSPRSASATPSASVPGNHAAITTSATSAIPSRSTARPLETTTTSVPTRSRIAPTSATSAGGSASVAESPSPSAYGGSLATTMRRRPTRLRRTRRPRRRRAGPRAAPRALRRGRARRDVAGFALPFDGPAARRPGRCRRRPPRPAGRSPRHRAGARRAASGAGRGNGRRPGGRARGARAIQQVAADLPPASGCSNRPISNLTRRIRLTASSTRAWVIVPAARPVRIACWKSARRTGP